MEKAFGCEGVPSEDYGGDNSVGAGGEGGAGRYGLFKDGKGSSRRRLVRSSMDADEFMTLLHGSDPVKVELNRLENEVREKNRELGEAQAEIKALWLS